LLILYRLWALFKEILQTRNYLTVHFNFYIARYSQAQLFHLFETEDDYANLKEAIAEAQVIVIDEISMVSAKILAIIEAICR